MHSRRMLTPWWTGRGHGNKLPFNADKCKVLRVGYKQEGFQYRMNSDTNTSVLLGQCNVEKGFGVHVDDQLNINVHIWEAINKSNRLLRTIRRAYQFLDADKKA